MAAVLSVLVIVPLACAVAAGLAHSSATTRQLTHFVLASAIWFGIAAGLALYGGYRIESLRKQVQAGRRLGQYTLKHRLGHGGMGEVYLAQHAMLRRLCAVKVVQPDRLGSRSALRRFQREVQATAQLSSPHIVEIYDYGFSKDGLYYYVMEYLPGANLQQLVDQHGPLSAGRVIYLMKQLCAALQEAHENNLIHRDIKPSNVIICQRGGLYDSVKLLDFGLAREASEEDSETLTAADSIAGTPAYMSPEQAQGSDEIDARSDIYSLGAVAYFLLTGRPLFEHASVMKTVAAHIYEPVIAPSDYLKTVPSDLEAVVLKSLSKLP